MPEDWLVPNSQCKQNRSTSTEASPLETISAGDCIRIILLDFHTDMTVTNCWVSKCKQLHTCLCTYLCRFDSHHQSPAECRFVCITWEAPSCYNNTVCAACGPRPAGNHQLGWCQLSVNVTAQGVITLNFSSLQVFYFHLLPIYRSERLFSLVQGQHAEHK